MAAPERVQPKILARSVEVNFCHYFEVHLNVHYCHVVISLAAKLDGLGCRPIGNAVRFPLSQESAKSIPTKFPCVGPREPRMTIT